MAARPATVALPRSMTVVTVLIGFLLVGGVLYWARAVLIPIALAILVTFLLSPLVIRLQRWGLPKAAAVPAVVLFAFAVLGAIGWLVSSQLVRLTTELQGQEVRTAVFRKIDQVKALQQGGHFEGIGRLFRDARERFEGTPETPNPPEGGRLELPEMKPIPVQVEPEADPITQAATTYLAPLVEPLVTAGLVVVLVIFMLLKREDLRNRIVTLSGRSNLAVTTKALDEAGQRIARYLLMQLVINVTYGIAVAIGLALMGVPYAVLWGVAAAVLRYIPFVGPWIAASLPLAYSALTSPGWGQPFGVIALVLLLELLSNNVMEPLLYGRGVGVSEIAVILSAVFWGWLWGPIGLVLATPLTACLVVAGRYVPALSALNRILGDAPEVEPSVVYYQRLLARDEDEAEELFDDHVERTSLAQAVEEVVVPALEAVKCDRMRRLIDAEQEGFILESIAEHVGDAPAPAPDTNGAAAEPDLPLVFGYAIRDAEDETAVRVMARLMEGAPCRFEVLSRSVLLGELITEIRERRPAGLCLIGLPPGGVTHARSLCKRLHAALPDLNIAVGRWAGPLTDKHRAALREQGATYFGRTPTETREHVLSMARLRPLTEQPAAPAAPAA